MPMSTLQVQEQTENPVSHIIIKQISTYPSIYATAKNGSSMLSSRLDVYSVPVVPYTSALIPNVTPQQNNQVTKFNKAMHTDPLVKVLFITSVLGKFPSASSFQQTNTARIPISKTSVRAFFTIEKSRLLTSAFKYTKTNVSTSAKYSFRKLKATDETPTRSIAYSTRANQMDFNDTYSLNSRSPLDTATRLQIITLLTAKHTSIPVNNVRPSTGQQDRQHGLQSQHQNR